MPRTTAPYSAVYNALSDFGESIRRGFGDLSSARLSAADFALKSAQIEANIEKERIQRPIIQAQAREAQNYLDKQKELDQPLTTDFMMGQLFRQDSPDFQLEHFFVNDIPGTILKTGGLTYNKEEDRYYKPDKSVVTRRDFATHMPMIQAAMVSKTDPVKMGNDMLEEAKRNGDSAAIARISKSVNDPKWMLSKYDQQEQYLINFMNASKNFGYDTRDIQASLDRIGRRRSELMNFITLDASLKAKGSTLKPGITEKDIAELYMKAYELVDKDMENRALSGQFEGWDDAKISAWKRREAATRVEDSLRQAGVIKSGPVVTDGSGKLYGDDFREKKASTPEEKKGVFSQAMEHLKGQPTTPGANEPAFGSGLDVMKESIKSSVSGIKRSLTEHAKESAKAGRFKRSKIKYDRLQNKKNLTKRDRDWIRNFEEEFKEELLQKGE